MFESITNESPAERLRRAAFPPLAAFLFALFCFDLFPLLPRIPPALIRVLDAIVFVGALAGAVAIVRAVRAGGIRGFAIVWLVFAVAADLVCARFFVSLTFPGW